jgi:hypothetical protein
MPLSGASALLREVVRIDPVVEAGFPVAFCCMEGWFCGSFGEIVSAGARALLVAG